MALPFGLAVSLVQILSPQTCIVVVILVVLLALFFFFFGGWSLEMDE